MYPLERLFTYKIGYIRHTWVQNWVLIASCLSAKNEHEVHKVV